MSKQEYETLTETEKLFIVKEHENKFMSSTTWMRNAVLNGVANAMRKKGKKFIELFPTKKQSRADVDYNKDALKKVEDMEAKKGKGWVRKIYDKLGIKPSKKGGN